MHTSLINGRLFDGEQILVGHILHLTQDKITDISTRKPVGDVIDLQGSLLVPGFIDIQVNGGGGVMVNDVKCMADFRQIAAAHRQYGTTSFIPTIISDTWSRMRAISSIQKEVMHAQISGIRGIHFEGPYLNKTRKGVHKGSILRSPDPDFIDLIQDCALGIRIVTVAPECVSPEFIKQVVATGCHVCLGHSNATYEQVQVALQAGARGFTHLFNAMSPFTSRAPGVVGAALEDPESWCGIIADGFHVHEASIRLACAAKKKGKIILVTDAMGTVGAVEKSFQLYGETIEAHGGRCATPSGVLAGSDLDMATAVRHCVQQVGLPLAESLRMASLYPATYLGLEHRLGRLLPGYQADLVLLDDTLKVTKTWIAGKMMTHAS